MDLVLFVVRLVFLMAGFFVVVVPVAAVSVPVVPVPPVVEVPSVRASMTVSVVVVPVVPPVVATVAILTTFLVLVVCAVEAASAAALRRLFTHGATILVILLLDSLDNTSSNFFCFSHRNLAGRVLAPDTAPKRATGAPTLSEPR